MNATRPDAVRGRHLLMHERPLLGGGATGPPPRAFCCRCYGNGPANRVKPDRAAKKEPSGFI